MVVLRCQKCGNVWNYKGKSFYGTCPRCLSKVKILPAPSESKAKFGESTETMDRESGLRTRLLVRDVMSSPAITVNEDEQVSEVAQLMTKRAVGGLIVAGVDGRPVGMITKQDLVSRALAKGRSGVSLSAKDIMTSPIIMIDPDESLDNAARQMSRLNVRRLGVLYKGDIVGIISSKDILAVMPEFLETIQEKVLIEGDNLEEIKDSAILSGYCDRCGQWADQLKEVRHEFLCEKCRT